MSLLVLESAKFKRDKMKKESFKNLIELGIKVADAKLSEEDRIWSQYSNDKVDIGEELAKVIRTLYKSLPLSERLRALSIGSSAEPQFRILETAFRGGLYLLDIDPVALDIVKERIKRQWTDHVTTIQSNYNNIFLNSKNTEHFLRNKLHNEKLNLITLHHSLYYCKEFSWHVIFNNLYKILLSKAAAIHTVLMASKSNNEYTTTWMYNHFAGKYFKCINDQDLINFEKELEKDTVFNKAQILLKTHNIHFFVNDFAKFMKVIWMILLYPDVHKYSQKQKEEITEFVYKKFWRDKNPLIQIQNHLAIYKGIKFRGKI